MYPGWDVLGGPGEAALLFLLLPRTTLGGGLASFLDLHPCRETAAWGEAAEEEHTQ